MDTSRGPTIDSFNECLLTSAREYGKIGEDGNCAELGLTSGPREVLRTDFNETLQVDAERKNTYVVYGCSSK